MWPFPTQTVWLSPTWSEEIAFSWPGKRCEAIFYILISICNNSPFWMQYEVMYLLCRWSFPCNKVVPKSLNVRIFKAYHSCFICVNEYIWVIWKVVRLRPVIWFGNSVCIFAFLIQFYTVILFWYCIPFSWYCPSYFWVKMMVYIDLTSFVAVIHFFVLNWKREVTRT